MPCKAKVSEDRGLRGKGNSFTSAGDTQRRLVLCPICCYYHPNCIYIYLYLCVYVYRCIMYIYVDGGVYVRKHTCVACICIGVYLHVCTVYKYVHASTYIYTYVCVHMCLPVGWHQATATNCEKDTMWAGPQMEKLTAPTCGQTQQAHIRETPAVAPKKALSLFYTVKSRHSKTLEEKGISGRKGSMASGKQFLSMTNSQN